MMEDYEFKASIRVYNDTNHKLVYPDELETFSKYAFDIVTFEETFTAKLDRIFTE